MFTYFLILAVSIIILFSSPFLKIPFDPLDHLMRIRSLIEFDQCTVFGQEFVRGRCFWHNIWATIFKILDINNPIVWAKIIHVSQTLLTFYALLISGHFVFKGLLRDRNRLYLSLISACLWMTGGVGTFSTLTQQSWIMWYSVTYIAFSTPLAIIIFGIIVNLLSSPNTKKKHLFSKVEFFFFLHT